MEMREIQMFLYFDWFSEARPAESIDVLICWVPSVSLEILRPAR